MIELRTNSSSDVSKFIGKYPLKEMINYLNEGDEIIIGDIVWEIAYKTYNLKTKELIVYCMEQ